MKKILVVEDEVHLNSVIYSYLEKRECIVVSAFNGQEAIDLFDESFDLVIIDLMLPIIDGYGVCKNIRETSDVFIVMLTALREEENKLRGYDYGIDEYVTKPFSLDVLYAKINAILSRNRTVKTDVFKGIELDRQKYKVYINKIDVHVTPKEFKLLTYLIDNRSIVLTREQITNHIWGYDYYGDVRVVDTHIKNLRKKIKSQGKYIKTVKGIGYTLEVENES